MDIGKLIFALVMFLVPTAIIIAAVVDYNKLTPEQRAAREKEFKEKYAVPADYVKTDTPVQCPYCGSTQIQMVPRRWTIMMGLFTNKVDRICLRCKKKF